MSRKIVLLVLQSALIAPVLCYKWDLKKDLALCQADCDSEIFCRGAILNDVQLSQIYDDGTTFVEKRLLYSEREIVDKYKKFKQKTGGRPSREQLRKFVDENFANDSLSVCTFEDFTENPSILQKTNNRNYKQWLQWLNRRWVEMGGVLHDDVKLNPGRHSYLWVPNKFVKAGGRFTGTYYWDSYWIIRGLLLSDMRNTARGMIENIISLVDDYGHMPNGNRKYYLKRSQPPMLIQMAAEYYDVTKNSSFIKLNLPVFHKEFQWWVQNRSVSVEKNGQTYLMYRYKTLSCDPRPESYLDDYELVRNLSNPQEIMRIFTGIRSAAESGWDFSSRHFRGVNNSINGNLRTMDSMNMVYVDLNSIMYTNAVRLSQWFGMFGPQEQARKYSKIASDLLEAIDRVLWNETVGIWLDYDLVTDSSRNYFYLSNLTPLWSKAYKRTEQVERAVNYLKSQGVVKKDLTPAYYCVPTSMDNSTQQWDYPNCWAPLQAFLIHGLASSGNKNAEKVALNFSQMWIRTTYEGFRNTTEMYEKYDALIFGGSGGGGEYAPQTGFGWTNGLTMDLFNMWGNKLQ